MFKLQGKHGIAEVMTDNIDEVTINQIVNFLNEDFTKDVRVAIMPDTHAGKDAVVGTTMEVKNKIVPNLVGADIGCGVMCAEVKFKDVLNLPLLDETIKNIIPLGPTNHDKAQKSVTEVKLDKLVALQNGDASHLWTNLATLGGGNHFLELCMYDDRFFLTVHTGSRSVGSLVCKYHQKTAYKAMRQEAQQKSIETIKNNFHKSEWQKHITNLKNTTFHQASGLNALTGSYMDAYLHDLDIAQKFAYHNRLLIIQRIVKAMNWNIIDMFDSVHNYVDLDHMIMRKGAISAREGERIIVPINMRDGSLIAIGKGNDDWNQSAPHGAGRLLSRSKAKAQLNVDTFKDQMKDVYSSTVGENTLDEAPDAYKPIDDIIEKTQPTMDLQFIIKPIYNVKG